MNVKNWHTRIMCPHCGYHEASNLGDVEKQCWSKEWDWKGTCPGCGGDIVDHDRDSLRAACTNDVLLRKSMRWVPMPVWFKPWTWTRGIWETKDG